MEGNNMPGLMEQIKNIKKERAEQGEPASAKDQKKFGEVRVTFYREGAYRTDADGNKVPMGGDSNGNYDRICRGLGIDGEDSGMLADILDTLVEDLVSGKLKYTS